MKLANVVGPYTLEFADAGDGIFMCLAQYALADDEYRTYYKEKAAQGNEVILDNGAAEGGAMPLERLLLLVDSIKPTVWVVPDYVRDAPRTLWSLIEMQDELSSQVPFPYMVVPQGKSVWDWRLCMDEMLMRVPSHCWFGVSKFLDETRWQALDVVCDGCDEPPYSVVWHLLGVSSVESLVKCVNDFPWLHSVDTSLAVAAGMKDISIKPGMHKVEMDFRLPCALDRYSRVMDNIQDLRAIVHGQASSR